MSTFSSHFYVKFEITTKKIFFSFFCELYLLSWNWNSACILEAIVLFFDKRHIAHFLSCRGRTSRSPIEVETSVFIIWHPFDSSIVTTQLGDVPLFLQVFGVIKMVEFVSCTEENKDGEHREEAEGQDPAAVGSDGGAGTKSCCSQQVNRAVEWSSLTFHSAVKYLVDQSSKAHLISSASKKIDSFHIFNFYLSDYYLIIISN